MTLSIDPSSSTPPFEQVRRGVIAEVRSGELVAGSRLPTVRALADQLGLAVNTVARAYRELESDGVIETRGRNGSVVLASGDSIHRSIEAAARQYADLVAELGVAPVDALAIVTAALSA
ncbi:MAG: GntR family transcriptional regulator [Microbacteriaceae bacterium]|jgi:DNA-binding transcriptional regulator YhcF (GntR family)|nr:GntR family transcriptional regulator [Microbacteriaceae bacterium]